jgi:DNA repair protein RadC
MEQFQSKFTLKVTPTQYPVVKVKTITDVVNVLKSYYGDDIEIFESFYVLLLNNANETIGYVKLSQGGITGTVVDIRLLLKYVIESLATAIVITHNHPSGKLIASEMDLKLTKKINSALKLIDVTLLDHVILTNYGYLSMRENGDL